jgi:kynurenine formamidase
MRRSIDLSMIVEARPAPDPVFPPNPPAPHKEFLGTERRREDAMFILRIQPSQFGAPPVDRFEQITCTVDPSGTHLETYYPKRFFYGGVNDWSVRDVAHFPIKQLVNEAIVIEASDMDRALTPSDLEERAPHLRDGDSVLIRTSTNHAWRDPGLHRDTMGLIYGTQTTGLTVDAAKWLSDREIGILGFDCRSPEDPTANWNLKTHEQLLTHNVMLCEDIANLDHLTQDRVLLIGGTPLKGQHLTGVPARMVALESDGDQLRPIDLTHVLGCYPEDAPFSTVRTELVEDRLDVARRMDILFFDMSEMGLGDSTGPEYMRFSSQAGTHLINPMAGKNFTPLYEDLTKIPIDRLVGKGVLIDLSHLGPQSIIDASHIRDAGQEIEPGDWVFVRTDHADWYRHSPHYFDYSPTFSEDAIQELGRLGATGLVTDATQLCPLADRLSMHELLHEHKLLAVEAAWHLWLIRKPRFTTAVLPLNVVGLISSPVHVFAIEEW